MVRIGFKAIGEAAMLAGVGADGIRFCTPADFEAAGRAAIGALIPPTEDQFCHEDCPFALDGHFGCSISLEAEGGKGLWGMRPGPDCPANKHQKGDRK